MNKEMAETLIRTGPGMAMAGGIDTAHVAYGHRHEVAFDPLHKAIHADYEDVPGSFRPKTNRDNGDLIDRMLHGAALNLAQGIGPPALDAGKQGGRAADVLCNHADDAATSAAAHLADGLKHPLYSI